MTERHTVAVIPNYNMAEAAGNLAESLLSEEFSHIYILDDNSPEDAKAIISDRFDDRVKVVEGKKNLGAAGNRNRILQVLDEQGAPLDTAIAFIDADTALMPADIPLAAKDKREYSTHERH
jgi:GT2 family glycosyltransferase